MKFKTIVFLLFTLLLISCGRTPSKTRLENTTGIILSENIQVIEDSFQEIWTDYGLVYKVKLNSLKECQAIVKQLTANTKWKKKDDNISYHASKNGIVYNVIFHINECEIQYQEDLL